MAMTHEWKHSQNFMLTMNVKEEELSDPEYVPQENEEEEEEEEDYLSVSQLSLRSRRRTHHSSPSVKQREPWKTKKNVLNTRRSPLSSTHMTKRKVPGDPRKHVGCKRKRTMFDNFNEHEKSSASTQVEEIQAILGAEYPIVVKSMIHSNVSSWNCLVYIMGRHNLAEVDAAFSLLKLNACAKHEVLEENHPKPLSSDVCQGNTRKTSLMLDTKPELIDNQTEEDNEKFGSKFPGGIRYPVPAADFEDVRSIENFTILVNGVTIDSWLSKQLRTNYYELCCSRGSFLHDHLLKSINSKLAAEIISETTNIANAIRARKLSASHADYEMWEKTLNAFGLLGMDVGFLHARLKRLLSPSFRSEEAVELKRIEDKVEQICAGGR
ncbi:unnamed protein product [Prunus armeniaca]|uniref:Uncharacterized protein n=1 Tax=Prunus armeniaca TaxID=36596 RepID=A0A6J5VS30_PRUAR|nr:unnamed protein product [Prunus armeniaca]